MVYDVSIEVVGNLGGGKIMGQRDERIEILKWTYDQLEEIDRYDVRWSDELAGFSIHIKHSPESCSEMLFRLRNEDELDQGEGMCRRHYDANALVVEGSLCEYGELVYADTLTDVYPRIDDIFGIAGCLDQMLQRAAEFYEA